MLYGDIIEESLKDKAVLGQLHIVATKVEPITQDHQTPWLKQWTLHTVAVPEDQAEAVAKALSRALNGPQHWYADYKNDATHYVIFADKVFKVDRRKPEQYKSVVAHGLSLGIPDYQLDFSPAIQQWERPEA